MVLTRSRFGLIPLVYLVVGVIVAATHHYFQHVDSLRTVGSAILAVILWPLLLLGIDLHMHR
jgi:hypothetical protein